MAQTHFVPPTTAFRGRRHGADADLVRQAAAAELAGTSTFDRAALARARALRAEVERRGLGAAVVRALVALEARPGPAVRVVRTPRGPLPSLCLVDLLGPGADDAPESCPEVDPCDVLSLETAP